MSFYTGGGFIKRVEWIVDSQVCVWRQKVREKAREREIEKEAKSRDKREDES